MKYIFISFLSIRLQPPTALKNEKVTRKRDNYKN